MKWIIIATRGAAVIEVVRLNQADALDEAIRLQKDGYHTEILIENMEGGS